MTAVTSELVKGKPRWDFLLVYQLNYNCLPLWFGIMISFNSVWGYWAAGVCTLVWLITSPIAVLAALEISDQWQQRYHRLRLLPLVFFSTFR